MDTMMIVLIIVAIFLGICFIIALYNSILEYRRICRLERWYNKKV